MVIKLNCHCTWGDWRLLRVSIQRASPAWVEDQVSGSQGWTQAKQGHARWWLLIYSENQSYCPGRNA